MKTIFIEKNISGSLSVVFKDQIDGKQNKRIAFPHNAKGKKPVPMGYALSIIVNASVRNQYKLGLFKMDVESITELSKTAIELGYVTEEEVEELFGKTAVMVGKYNDAEIKKIMLNGTLDTIVKYYKDANSQMQSSIIDFMNEHSDEINQSVIRKIQEMSGTVTLHEIEDLTGDNTETTNND